VTKRKPQTIMLTACITFLLMRVPHSCHWREIFVE